MTDKGENEKDQVNISHMADNITNGCTREKKGDEKYREGQGKECRFSQKLLFQ
jgi:hypothetical protein